MRVPPCRYDLDDLPSGASRTGSVCPNKTPFGEFRDNVAHTCNEFGLRVWETYIPYVDGCGATEPDTATLYDFVSYGNGIHGLELSVVGHVRLVRFKVADNVQNGMEIQETLGTWGGPMIRVSGWVGGCWCWPWRMCINVCYLHNYNVRMLLKIQLSVCIYEYAATMLNMHNFQDCLQALAFAICHRPTHSVNTCTTEHSRIN